MAFFPGGTSRLQGDAADTSSIADGGSREWGFPATKEVTTNLDRLLVGGRAGWILTCEKPYVSPAFPDHQLFERYTFSSPKDGKAVLRVKSLEPGGDWRTSDLDLNLPPDVQWMRIVNKPHTN